jgi:hypothetical protein
MCKCDANYEELALARRLRGRGIPVDEYQLERIQAACAGLEIFEDTGLPSTVFNLSSGGAGYILNVMIANISARPLAPAHIGFEGPDWEPGITLLPDPHKEYPALRRTTHRQVRDYRGVGIDYPIARNTYFFPNDWTIGYHRSEVVNCRIGRSRLLYPGESREGWLMAAGQRPIPPEYRDRDRFTMFLTVFDHRNRFHRAPFHPVVLRSRHEEPLDSGAASATRLRDDPKPNLGQEERSVQVTSRRA